MTKVNQYSHIQSVDRALSILDLLQGYEDGRGVVELANHLGVAKSTTHRLLTTLRHRGYVQQISQTQKYKLGLKLLELGNEVSDSLDIRKIAHPYLLQLSKETGETAHLVLLDKNEVVYIDKVESLATIRMKSNIGKRAPSYCTGVGKAMLALLSEEEKEQVIASSELKKFTENTIIRKDDLLQELDLIKEKGYSYDNEEHEKGIRCVATGILNFHKEVVAGISVAGPSMRMTDEKMYSDSKKIKVCAQEISKALGFS